MSALFRYIALGDSSGVGVGAGGDGGYPERLYRRLKQDGVPAGILNLAQSGATSERVRGEQVPKVASRRPALVTLGIGVNDVWRLVTPSQFGKNLEAISAELARSGAEVVVFDLPDMSHAPAAAIAQSALGISKGLIRSRIEEFNAVLARQSRAHGFHLVDLFAASEALPHRPELFHYDGFHPSSAGYDEMAARAWPHVASVAQRWRARVNAPAPAA